MCSPLSIFPIWDRSTPDVVAKASWETPFNRRALRTVVATAEAIFESNVRLPLGRPAEMGLLFTEGMNDGLAVHIKPRYS